MITTNLSMKKFFMCCNYIFHDLFQVMHTFYCIHNVILRHDLEKKILWIFDKMLYFHVKGVETCICFIYTASAVSSAVNKRGFVKRFQSFLFRNSKTWAQWSGQGKNFRQFAKMKTFQIFPRFSNLHFGLIW